MVDDEMVDDETDGTDQIFISFFISFFIISPNLKSRFIVIRIFIHERLDG